MKAQVHAFYHQDTSTLSYIVFDQPGGHAIVIDSVLDFSLSSGSVGTKFSDGLIVFLQDHQLEVPKLLYSLQCERVLAKNGHQDGECDS